NVKKIEDYIQVKYEDSLSEFKLVNLPEDFINWQIFERKNMFDFLKKGENPSFFSPHLPTLVTWDIFKKDFMVNLACKGIGLIAKENKMESITREIRKVLNQIQNLSFKDSIRERVEAALILYKDKSNIDYNALGGIEIFESTSFKNILTNPQVSLFYVGSAPVYKSYQINCIAEILKPESILYQFIKSIRELFEEANFHFQQPKYPFAVRYHVIEVLDKSLKLRNLKGKIK
ncbi:MAG: hypothetical protein ACYCXO_14285, partial [Candidatus Humimicrobiaceae bacterium]